MAGNLEATKPTLQSQTGGMQHNDKGVMIIPPYDVNAYLSGKLNNDPLKPNYDAWYEEYQKSTAQITPQAYRDAEIAKQQAAKDAAFAEAARRQKYPYDEVQQTAANAVVKGLSNHQFEVVPASPPTNSGGPTTQTATDRSPTEEEIEQIKKLRKAPGDQVDPKYGNTFRESPPARAGEPKLSHRDRAAESQQDMLAHSRIDTRRTPEEQRTEHYARLADMLNNQLYYKPSVTRFGTGTGTQVISEGGATQMPKIETEDMRQQQLANQRRSDKLAYNELGRMQEANDVYYKQYGLGEQNLTDLEGLRLTNDESIRTYINQNEAALKARLRTLQSNVAALEMYQEAGAKMDISVQQTVLLMDIWRKAGWTAAAIAGSSMGVKTPGLLSQILGSLAQSLTKESFGEQSASLNQIPIPYTRSGQ